MDNTLRLHIFLEVVILYFCPDDSSFPFLYHLVLSSGVPDTVHSKTAGSPAVTFTDSVLSEMAAGSENSKQPSELSEGKKKKKTSRRKAKKMNLRILQT